MAAMTDGGDLSGGSSGSGAGRPAACEAQPRPLLIHLNGPSRIGKSTLARRYGEEHPGVLVLDIDVIAGMIGGASDDFLGAGSTAREPGRAMARHHLARGRDVVVPQLFTTHDTDPRFDLLADEAGAAYAEIALLADTQTHRRRVRDKRPVNEIEEVVQRLLEEQSDLLDRIDEHLGEYLDERHAAVRLDTSRMGVDETYRTVLAIIGRVLA